MKTTDERYLKQLQAAVSLRQLGYLDMAMTLADNLLPERGNEPALWHTFGQIKTDLGEFPEFDFLYTHRERIMNSLPAQTADVKAGESSEIVFNEDIFF
jgi:hypothetical protein